MDTHLFRSAPARRLLTLAASLAAVGVLAPIANAADLIQLSGEDPVRFDGTVSYDRLFLDGVVRLGSDATINATEVTIGPNAQLQLCWVDNGTANGLNDTCVNGRNLAIVASGGIAIAPGIDLTGGNAAVARPGGSLVLKGSHITVGGDITTTGQTGAPSGSVQIDSTGTIFAQSITAPGSNVTVRGAGGVAVVGVSTSGDPITFVSEANRAPNAGSVDLGSTAGDVSVLGAITTNGRDGTAALGENGGNAGAIAVSGGDVHLFGDVASDGGTSQNGAAGGTGAITLAARGALTAARVFAPGSGGPLGAGGGGTITLSAVGSLVTGAITDTGGSSRPGGAPGGTTTVSGGSVALGPIDLRGGSGSDNTVAADGQPGGALKVSGAATVSLASITARGGDARLTGIGGSGGSIDIRGDRVSTNSIDVSANSFAASGGTVRVQGSAALSVGGAVMATAQGGTDTHREGGNGGSVTLIAAHGPLTLGGVIRTSGATGDAGTAIGGNGGNGGPVELVAHSVGSALGVDTSAGDGGTANAGGTRGNGGTGGLVRIWSQLGALATLGIVETAGGDAGAAQTGGGINGLSGATVEEYAPTEPSFTAATRTLGFTSHSPDAEAFRIVATPAGGAPAVIGQTTAASAVMPVATPCVAITYSVVALKTSLAWETDPVAAAPVTFDPSKTQKCVDAPELKLSSKTIKRTLKQLKRSKWKLKVTASADGIGSATAVLRQTAAKTTSKAKKGKKGKKIKLKTTKIATVAVTLTKVGPVTFQFVLPAKYRKAGEFTVAFVTKAPIGAKSWGDQLGVTVKSSPLGKKTSKSHNKGKK